MFALKWSYFYITYQLISINSNVSVELSAGGLTLRTVFIYPEKEMNKMVFLISPGHMLLRQIYFIYGNEVQGEAAHSYKFLSPERWRWFSVSLSSIKSYRKRKFGRENRPWLPSFSWNKLCLVSDSSHRDWSGNGGDCIDLFSCRQQFKRLA